MSGAKIIRPITVAGAMLVSSTVAEPAAGETAWVSGTSYTAGDIRLSLTSHKLFKRLISGAGTTAPESDPTNWVGIGTGNRWSMFDRRIGTVSSVTSPLTVVVEPGGGVSGVSLLELTGREATISMKDTTGGTVVYSQTVSLDGSFIDSFYDWFFSDYEQLSGFSLTDLPSQFPANELTISVTGTGTVSCGVAVIGNVLTLGVTHYGAQVGIIDYSRKQADEFGNIDIVERNYRSRTSFKITTETSDFNKIYRVLASLRATPCIVIGEDSVGFEPMTSYCLISDFTIDVAYPTYNLCNLETEGMT